MLSQRLRRARARLGGTKQGSPWQGWGGRRTQRAPLSYFSRLRQQQAKMAITARRRVARKIEAAQGGRSPARLTRRRPFIPSPRARARMASASASILPRRHHRQHPTSSHHRHRCHLVFFHGTLVSNASPHISGTLQRRRRAALPPPPPAPLCVKTVLYPCLCNTPTPLVAPLEFVAWC